MSKPPEGYLVGCCSTWKHLVSVLWCRSACGRRRRTGETLTSFPDHSDIINKSPGVEYGCPPWPRLFLSRKTWRTREMVEWIFAWPSSYCCVFLPLLSSIGEKGWKGRVTWPGEAVQEQGRWRELRELEAGQGRAAPHTLTFVAPAHLVGSEDHVLFVSTVPRSFLHIPQSLKPPNLVFFIYCLT